jgi:hypothetical protein
MAKRISMVVRTNMTLANELLMLRISLGPEYEKQAYFASVLGISARQYNLLERHGKFTRKMLAKIRIKYPGFAAQVFLD